MNDTTATPRIPAGVPTGGQFASAAHAEADVALLGRPEALLDDLIADEPRAYFDISHDVSGFSDAYIERTPGTDTFDVVGNNDLDMVEGIAAARGCDGDAAVEWLDEHQSHIDAWLDHAYESSFADGWDQWDEQRLESRVTVPCNADLDGAIEALSENRGASALNDDLNRGTFFVRLLNEAERRKYRTDRTLTRNQARDVLHEKRSLGLITEAEYLSTFGDDDAAAERTESLLFRYNLYLDEND